MNKKNKKNNNEKMLKIIKETIFAVLEKIKFREV